MEKHSSLFWVVVSDRKKGFYNVSTWTNPILIFGDNLMTAEKFEENDNPQWLKVEEKIKLYMKLIF
jgi:hypothetical protein